MKRILLINPKKGTKKPSKKRAKKKGSSMARKKKAKKRSPARRRRRNPSTRRKAIVRRASSTIAGLNPMSALKNAIPLTAGMLGSKFFAKRLGAGASELDPDSWTWRSYLQMAAGGFATGIVANMLKRGTGQKALEGALSLLAYELMQNELIAPSETMSGWLGEDDEPFIYGDDGEPIPLDDSYRMQLDLPELPEGMEGALEPPGRLGFGDAVGPAGRLGEIPGNLDARYRMMYFGH